MIFISMMIHFYSTKHIKSTYAISQHPNSYKTSHWTQRTQTTRIESSTSVTNTYFSGGHEAGPLWNQVPQASLPREGKPRTHL